MVTQEQINSLLKQAQKLQLAKFNVPDVSVHVDASHSSHCYFTVYVYEVNCLIDSFDFSDMDDMAELEGKMAHLKGILYRYK